MHFVPLHEALPYIQEGDVKKVASSWHQTINNAPSLALKKMTLDPQNVVPDVVADVLPLQFTYTTWMVLNTPKVPHRLTDHEYKSIESISCNSVGPIPHIVLGGESHVITFIDFATSFFATILLWG